MIRKQLIPTNVYSLKAAIILDIAICYERRRNGRLFYAISSSLPLCNNLLTDFEKSTFTMWCNRFAETVKAKNFKLFHDNFLNVAIAPDGQILICQVEYSEKYTPLKIANIVKRFGAMLATKRPDRSSQWKYWLERMKTLCDSFGIQPIKIEEVSVYEEIFKHPEKAEKNANFAELLGHRFDPFKTEVMQDVNSTFDKNIELIERMISESYPYFVSTGKSLSDEETNDIANRIIKCNDEIKDALEKRNSFLKETA